MLLMVVAEAAAAALVCDLVTLLVDDGVSIRTNACFQIKKATENQNFLANF